MIKKKSEMKFLISDYHTVFMKLVCFISPLPKAPGYETHNSFHKYLMKWKWISDPIFIYHPPFVKAGDILTHSSVRLSVSPSVRLSQNFYLTDIFLSINDRALIFGMHDPCDKSSLLVPCGDLDLDFLPTSRSNLLPGGGPQFFEFACYTIYLKSKCNLT